MSKNNEHKLVPKYRFPEFANHGNWQEKTFSQLFEFGNGKDYKHLLNGDIPVYGTGGKMLSVNDYLYDGESVCIGRKGTIDSPLFLTGKFWTVDTLFYTHSFVNSKPKFIYYIFQNVNWYEYNEAGGVPSLSKTTIKKIKTLIPPRINEQEKIVACLSSLDEVITAESQKLDLLQNHKRGLLQNLLPVGNETTPKFRFKEFENSDEWVEDTLINLANFRRGSFPQPYGLPEWYDDENGMPFIQVFDVGEDFRLKPTTKRKISERAAQQSVFIPKGTLIITIQGSIGRVAITQYDAYIDRTLLLFEEFHQEIDITFFAYTLFLLFEIEKQKAPGGIIKTITKEVLSSFVVKLPSIEEQRKIASCLSSLDELISAQNQKIEALKQHKKGLLQSMFPTVNN
jgi:type I restriction enzyme S subunit